MHCVLQSGGKPNMQSQQLEKQHSPAPHEPSALHGAKLAQRPSRRSTQTPGFGEEAQPVGVPFDLVKHDPLPPQPEHVSSAPQVSP